MPQLDLFGPPGADTPETAQRAAKPTVNYRPGEPPQVCVQCQHFLGQGPGGGECELVEGVILPEDTCDMWAAEQTAAPGPEMDLFGPPMGAI